MANGDELQAFVNLNPWRVEATDWVEDDLQKLTPGELRAYEAFRELLRNVDPHTRIFHYLVGTPEALEVTYTLTRGAADQVILKCTVPAGDRRQISMMAVYLFDHRVCRVSEVISNRV